LALSIKKPAENDDMSCDTESQTDRNPFRTSSNLTLLGAYRRADKHLPTPHFGDMTTLGDLVTRSV